MKTDTIPGTYGSRQTPCDIYTATDRHGITWYAVHGSSNVNATPETLAPGVDVETVADVDTFTWPDGIHSEAELIEAIES